MINNTRFVFLVLHVFIVWIMCSKKKPKHFRWQLIFMVNRPHWAFTLGRCIYSLPFVRQVIYAIMQLISFQTNMDVTWQNITITQQFLRACSWTEPIKTNLLRLIYHDWVTTLHILSWTISQEPNYRLCLNTSRKGSSHAMCSDVMKVLLKTT